MPGDWFRDFFEDLGEDFDRIFAFRVARTAEDADDVEAALRLPKGSRILDLCCGSGRVSLELARRGYVLTGVDLSPSLLEVARRRAEAEGLRVRWFRRDMRRLGFRARFDGVVNLFNSFGYFEDPEDDARVLQEVVRALKPKGRFLLETMNGASFLRNFEARGWSQDGDVLILEDRAFDPFSDMLRAHWEIRLPDGRQLMRDVNMRVYLAAELRRMLQSAGLRVDASWGDRVGTPLTLDSRRLWIRAVAS